MINDGNIGAGVTGALGSVGGVIPGQAGTVINDLSANTGAAVGAAVSGDYQGLVTNAAGGAALVVGNETGNMNLANQINAAGGMAGAATNDFINHDYTGGAQNILNGVTEFTPGAVNQYMAPAGAGIISGVDAGVNGGGLQVGVTTGL